jgi:hypothetical protein
MTMRLCVLVGVNTLQNEEQGKSVFHALSVLLLVCSTKICVNPIVHHFI